MSISIGTRIGPIGVYKTFGPRKRITGRNLRDSGSAILVLAQMTTWIVLGVFCLEIAAIIGGYGILIAGALAVIPKTRSKAGRVFHGSIQAARKTAAYPNRLFR